MHHKFHFLRALHEHAHDHDDPRATGGRGPFGRPLWGERGERPDRHGPGHRGGPFGRGRFFDNGVLRLVVLALIAEQPRHGYEIIKEIEERTGGAYAPSAGVIYPTLTLLEETGLIEVASSEGNKKLYAATDAGRATVEENRAAIDAVLARFAEAGSDRRPERDPRLIRAVENMRLALRLKTQSATLTPEQIDALAELLDETARKIEQI